MAVSFQMEPEITAILGPSGCGKTMTLKCIAGLIAPDEGIIQLDERVLFDSARGINIAARRRKVGFVFQNYALFPHMTVYKNIAFGMRNISESAKREKIELFLQKMKLEHMQGRYPGQLSWGQQQRVALARALVNEPEVLLLDEPFSALDSIVKERLEEELLGLQEYYHGYVLFVTHNLSEAYRLSSKMAVYEAGNILQFAAKEEVVERPKSRAVAVLTGTKNLFPAQVVGTEGQVLQVKLLRYDIPLQMETAENYAYELQETVILGIRAEYVRIVDKPGLNCLPVVCRGYHDELAYRNYKFLLGKDVLIEARVIRGKVINVPCGADCFIEFPSQHLFVVGG